jgi:hypothetical protein
MKPVVLCGPPPAASATVDAKLTWLLTFAGEVIRNSKIDATTISDGYTVSNLPATPVRALNVASVTLTELADFIGQYVSDLKRRGPNNGT